MGDLPQIRSFCTWQGRLVAGGWFYYGPQGGRSYSLLYQEGSAWRPLGTGVGELGLNTLFPGIVDEYDLRGTVLALAEYQGSLYAGGDFSVAGAKPSSGIARWDE